MRSALLPLLGIAALLSSAVPVQAMPMLAPPLLRPASLLTIVTVPDAPVLPSNSVQYWPRLWTSAADPSLKLADWSRVFDIAVLGGFDVPLRDDPGERTNILLAANAVDNVTLAPGQTFSFNDIVGERTSERGYEDGLMFNNGAVVRGTGGGICLVATGLYNAALNAGLEIDERHPHSGLVSYAPPGCDAGIYFGSEDLKFCNNTTSPLVIRAVPQDDCVQVRIFGRTPPLSRQIWIRPNVTRSIPAPIITKIDPTLLPGQSVIDQKPRAGYDVTVERFWLHHWRVVRREVVVQETRAPRPEIKRVAATPVTDVEDLLDACFADGPPG